MQKRIAVMLSCMLAVVAVTVHAHMALSKSMPEADAVLAEAPHHIQLWFTQEPDPAVSQITLNGPDGAVELGELMMHDDKSIMAMPKAALGPGTYTVGWRSAGDDGHVQRGDLTFSIRAD